MPRRTRSLLLDGSALAIVALSLQPARADGSTTLYNFCEFANCTDGSAPQSSVLADAQGNLFGTTLSGGVNNEGTVFELAKRHGAYTIVTLVSFDGTNGSAPFGGVVADRDGNLFGTTAAGGADNDCTVFEIAETKDGYARAPVILASFQGTDGATPVAGLIADPHGDLFGTTIGGGADDDGTVCELRKSGDRYGAPSLLVSFSGADGSSPFGGLTHDRQGNLFGTTVAGGEHSGGTVFEIPAP
jgi:uncharacterized repeat protein (TIGR03803 family)